MRIGIISDIHIPVFDRKLPEKVCDYFKRCDLIIHAGDAIEESVIRGLERFAETKAVRGNMDSSSLKRSLPEKLILKVEGKKIGVIHGSGPASKIIHVVSKSFTEKLDIIIFGHSHASFNETIDGTLFFNPGTACDNIFSKCCTFGIIEINGDDIKAEIIGCKD